MDTTYSMSLSYKSNVNGRPRGGGSRWGEVHDSPQPITPMSCIYHQQKKNGATPAAYIILISCALYIYAALTAISTQRKAPYNTAKELLFHTLTLMHNRSKSMSPGHIYIYPSSAPRCHRVVLCILGGPCVLA